MSRLPPVLDVTLTLCLFVALGSFVLRAVVVQFWYPLVTPWRAMALIGSIAATVLAWWVRSRDKLSMRWALTAWSAIFVASALAAMPILHAINGLLDGEAPTPRRAVVLRASARASNVRIELSDGALEVLLPVAIGRVQDGDVFTVHVGDGALGIPWCRLSSIRTAQDP